MGYACPVCGDPQQDAGHLASHLAFTAMLGDDGHEAWLDEHAPGWAEQGESELAERVVDHAEETEFPQVFEDTTADHEHGHDHEHANAGPDPTEMDEATRSAIEEARRMTEQRRDDGE